MLLGTRLGVPQRVLFECFLAFLGLKKRQKALLKHSLGHSEPGAQKHSKSKVPKNTQKARCPKTLKKQGAQKHSQSTPWGTFRPGPLGTPVNGGWDRKIVPWFSDILAGSHGAS